MAYRTIERVTVGTVTVAVAYDSEWQDYRARIVAPRNQINHDADAHDDDRTSIIGTARAMATQIAARIAAE